MEEMLNIDNVLDVADLDASIGRIYSKKWFIELLKTKKNVLARPSRWDDPFENFFLRATVTNPEGLGSLESLANGWYGQCWTFSSDNDAMWRIYSHAKDGIMVKTTVRKLFTEFYDETDEYSSLKYFIGRVDYMSESDISSFMSKTSFMGISMGGQGTKFAKLLCIKRDSFAHENEIRLLFQAEGGKANSDFAPFDMDVNAICSDVILDPRLTDAEAATLANELRAAGCHIAISKSPLYRVPSFTIPLS